MKDKKFYKNTTENMRAIWRGGKIQRSFNITYDVIWNIILFFLIVGFIGLFFAGGVGAGYFASLVKDEPIRSYQSMEKDIYNYEETTKLYFAGNVYFGDVRTDLYREEVALENVSDILINAVIATEDQSFYDHKGVVPKAIIRAVLQEAINSNVKTGGSTLTQQLIKNQILTNEVSFDRKAKEILLALRLENFFEKEQILEAYLNIIPYGRNSAGRNIAGIQTAAQGIFGVDADEVNIAQAAFLAGLPQSPSSYTPFVSGGGLKDDKGLTPGLNRMKTVLKRMYEAEFITKKEYEKALKYDIVADFTDPKESPLESYPRLTTELERRAEKILLEIVAEKDGYTLDDLDNNKDLKKEYEILAERELRIGGYNIYSTIDKDLYDNMQETIKNHKYFGPDRDLSETNEETGKTVEWTEQQQASAMLIENNTGKIISFAGGREFEQSEFNYATQGPRPNGSTMKSLAVYAPALEIGLMQPGSPIADIKTVFSNYGDSDTESGFHEPNNYSKGVFYGINSARMSLANSYNIAAQRTYAVLKDGSINGPFTDARLAEPFIKKMGFQHLRPEDFNSLSLSIGSMDKGITLEENTNAFSIFGNNGKFIDGYMIEKITTHDGTVVYEHESEPVDVFSPETAYLTLDMMRDVIDYGTATYLKSQLKHSGVDWAGKTGTSQFHNDAWFVGINPNVTLGVWTGYPTPYDINKNCSNCPLQGHSNRIQKLWAEFANGAIDTAPDLVAPDKRFTRPDGIVEKSICSISGMLPSELCKKAGLVTTDIFNVKYVPTEVDDSLMSGSYVLVNGKAVMAGDRTPKEFVEGDGLMFNPEFLKRNGYDELDDITQLFPRTNRHLWEKISVPSGDLGSVIEDDGKQPTAPKPVTASSDKLSWSSSSSKDVVGYRIYRAKEPGAAFQLIGSTRGTDYSIGTGKAVYHVKAVDYFGLESAASEEVIVGDFSEPEPDKDKDKGKDKDKNKDKDNNKDKDSNEDKNKDKDKNNNKEENKNADKNDKNNNKNNDNKD